MPGHDHSLRKLYTIEGLSNPSMVHNWVCPVMPKEEYPYEALAHVFNKYFTDTNRINTNEEYLNFGWATPYKARHNHKRLYTVLPKYSKIQVLPGITSCRLVKDNKQAIELNNLLINNMPKDGYEWN